MLAVPESNYYPVKTFNLSIDINNNIIDSTIYWGNHNKDYWTVYGYSNLARNSNNESAVTGYTYSFDTSGVYKILFSVFDSNTHNRFVKEFFDSAGNQYSSGRGVLFRNNAWYILATVQDTLYNGQILLIKTDSNGNALWKKHYGVSGLRDEPGCLLAISNGFFLIGYARNNLSTWGGVGLLQTNSRIMLIDSVGNQLSEWTDNTDSTFKPRSLTKTNDGGYIFITDHKQRTNFPDIFTNQVVIKLDSNFNKTWVKQYGPTDYQTFLYKIVQLQDSSFITGGTIWAGDSTHYNTAGWLMKLNENGDSIWSRKYSKVYSNFSENAIYDFDILDDGTILGVGQSNDRTAQTQGQQGWIIKVDSMGCLIPGCDTLTATSLKETPEEIIGVKVYPNPTKKMVYILLKSDNNVEDISFEVFDLNGKKLAEEKSANMNVTYLLNTETYSSGLYLVKIKQKGKPIANRKFVKTD